MHNVWPSPGLVHYIYIHFPGLLPRNRILPHAKFTLRPILAFSYFGGVMALEQWASVKFCGVVQGMELRNFRRGRHRYSAGWPSHWASAHILVFSVAVTSLVADEALV